MTISIRPATEQDCALILRFIQAAEGRSHRRDPGQQPVPPARPRAADLRSGRAAGHLFLQLLDLRPADRSRQPRHGAARAQRSGGRFEWSVLDWNQPAIDFYQSIGARPQAEWVRYRMHGEALTGFAAGSD